MMKGVLSLAMIKLEKNFIAFLDKSYPRQPYLEYPMFSNGPRNLFSKVLREMDELADEMYSIREDGFTREKLYAIMQEVADVSNTLDYLFEGVLKEYQNLVETTN